MMRFLPLLLAVLLASACDLPGRAPTRDEFDPAGIPAPKPPSESTPAADREADALLAEYARRFTEAYPLYPGDRIRIIVLGEPDLTFDALIPTEGSLNCPLIGSLRLVGRGVEEVRQELKERLAKGYLVDPDVSVLVQEYSKKRAYVLGAVSHPQEVELPSGHFVTLLQVISLAGGFLEDAAKHGVVIRRQRQIGAPDRIDIPVNVAEDARGLRPDPVILPHDVILVPSREKVYVHGQVQKPGAYVIGADQATSVTQLLALAGGMTRIARSGNIRILRRVKEGDKLVRRVYVVDVSRVLAGHPEEDSLVQPGDIIFVPESFF